MVKNIARLSQVTKTYQPFSPFSTGREDEKALILCPGGGCAPKDSILDGVDINPKGLPVHWVEENAVHRASILSESVQTTRLFLGAGKLAVRDDIRHISHIAVVDSDGLSLLSLKEGLVQSRTPVCDGDVRRVDLCLDRYTGVTHIAYICTKGEKSHLYLDGTLVNTQSDNIDYPFMALSQMPIGHVPRQGASFGLLTYKCRDTGQCFVRRLEDDGLGGEEELLVPECLGGVDFAINKDDVLFRLHAIEDGNLVPMTAVSSDSGATVSQFDVIDLGGFQADQVLPVNTPVVQDFLGDFHIPLEAVRGEKRILLDIIPADGAVVEALVLHGNGQGALARFPKKPSLVSRLGRGDGLTDGIGIIASGTEKGALFASNSQSGGIHFPSATMFNYEMPLFFTFAATECYTRGTKPNTVSMDYLFLEANSNGDPDSQELMLETWDMPLPEPLLSATASGDSVTVNILQDAWFREGKTTFTLDDPTASILSVRLIDERTAQIQFNTNNLQGRKLSFQMKDLFYFHSGTIAVQ